MPKSTHSGAAVPATEAERLYTLRSFDVLDSLPEPAFDDIATLAATICQSPIALVSLIDRDRQWFKACIGLGARETPRDQAFCAHAILEPTSLLVIEDATLDPRFRDNPLVLGEPHIRFYAGAPIVTDDGHALGTVCVIDREPRALSQEQCTALESLARQAAIMLKLRRMGIQRGEEKRELQRKITDALADDDAAHETFKQNQRVGSVGQLTGGIAHDFNNLLQTISTCLQLVEHRAHDADQVRRWSANGLQAVTHGAALIRQLLTFSRQESVEQESLCVTRSVHGMKELLARVLGPETQLAFQLRSEGVRVLTNATQLEAALLNLVINARDAMQGRGRIEVATRVFEAEGDPDLANGNYVELRVSDTGPGMPPEVARRAFEPFFSTKPEGKGTGLGLSQVYGVALKAGGIARIGTEPGAGTTVSLYLRTAVQEAGDADGECESASPVALRKRVRIILVDDEANVREALSELLRDANYDVEAVSGGIAALQAIDRSPPDVVVTDQAMQGLNGGLLARILAETHPRLPVMFMTGYDDIDAVKATLPEDAIVLRKPVLLDEFAQGVQTLLGD
ncbi:MULTISPECIES: ATP-binding protein [unclassified Caballeronia]|uniref:ATP-binding protein n=1 Tax=unclassified Caballeronia TaxID=2646786 RepID=UPI002857A676|nr:MULTISPECIES: ATP-binding protein [unclassified Caballeronia]MDR5773948.1 response regulator [Caballeronia sp. LZ002]MDR5849383.1 response regulator [Caballeronia sp. LZ003]